MSDKISLCSNNPTQSRAHRWIYVVAFLLLASTSFLIITHFEVFQSLVFRVDCNEIVVNQIEIVVNEGESASDEVIYLGKVYPEDFTLESSAKSKAPEELLISELKTDFGLFYPNKNNPPVLTSEPGPQPSCSLVKEEDRFDCNPDEPINPNVCLSRGCCWQPPKYPQLSVPYCFYPKDYSGYKIKSVRQSLNEVSIKLERGVPSGFPKDITNIQVHVSGLDNERVRIRIFDPEHARYEVPLPYFNLSQSGHVNSPLYSIEYDNKTEGILRIIRKNTQIPVFQTDLRQIVFSDQFIQLSNRVPSKYLFGIGEHFDSFRKEITWKRYTLFNRDAPPLAHVESSLYGSFAFYMMAEDDADRSFHGIYLLNSNAMDIILQPTPAVTYRTVGGILDFFIFMGPTAKNVVQQNVNLIGRPVMQPYWSLGFHLCKYGYGSLDKTRETMQRNLDAGIPLDVQWNDIDYMDRYNDFTYDKKNFADLPKFVDELHRRGMHYIGIMDAAISAGEEAGTYPPFDEGVKNKVLVLNSTGDVFIGKVWNLRSSSFPDYISHRHWPYWAKMYEHLYSEIKIDGAWIDMNEPSNFYDGQVDGCPKNNLENPPYTPGGKPLYQKTLCMSAKHELGTHYDLHNLYSLYNAYATYLALTKIRNKRPLIVTRSTFPGSGHYVAHWSGDVSADWESLRYSISNMFSFNAFGIPMIGTDICGFGTNTTVELCMRWSSLGAFYPFSRNHNADDTIEHDPVAMGSKVVDAAKYSLNQRYTLIPYLYYLLFKSHVNADTVVRPLFFEFPKDAEVYGIEGQFMWGSNLLFVPILYPNVSKVKAYFPQDRWFNYDTLKLFIDSKGEYRDLLIDDDKIGIFVRGGTITPTGSRAMNTHEQRKKPFELLVAPNSNGLAVGEYFNDDGESLDNIESGNYTLCYCTCDMVNLHCSGEKCDMSSFGSIKIINARPVSTVTLNGSPIRSFVMDEGSKVLTIRLPKMALINELRVNMI